MEQDQRKKRGILGKVFIGGPLWWLRGWKNIGKSAMALEDQKRLISYTKASTGRIVGNLKALRKNRDPNAPGAPDMTKFNEVMDHWGICRGELPLVIRSIKVQIAVYSALGIVSCHGFYYGVKHLAWWPIINAGLVFIMCASVIIGRYWRLQVLQSERFFSFKSWVTGKVN